MSALRGNLFFWKVVPSCTLVLATWKFHQQRGLESYSPWGHRESDTTKWLTLWLSLACRIWGADWFSFVLSHLHHFQPKVAIVLLKIFSKLCGSLMNIMGIHIIRQKGLHWTFLCNPYLFVASADVAEWSHLISVMLMKCCPPLFFSSEHIFLTVNLLILASFAI